MIQSENYSKNGEKHTRICCSTKKELKYITKNYSLINGDKVFLCHKREHAFDLLTGDVFIYKDDKLVNTGSMMGMFYIPKKDKLNDNKRTI